MVQTASEPVIPLPRVLKAAKAGPAPRVNLVFFQFSLNSSQTQLDLAPIGEDTDPFVQLNGVATQFGIWGEYH